jgi:hypothetical protein
MKLGTNPGRYFFQKCVKAWERAVNKPAQSWTHPVPTCEWLLCWLIHALQTHNVTEPVGSKNKTGAKNNVSRPTVVVDSCNAVLR